MSIKQLPADVVAQIKSSITITSLNSVILGLIKNSLDAQSSKITISVDYRRANCSVEDNGLGIAPAEFQENGGLGKLYCTSKYPPDTAHFGSRGAFLASVAALSLISITSHHHEHQSHNSLSIHNSKVLARNTPAVPEQRLLASLHGTRVTVRDLFGSMPVRVKQRASEMDKPGVAREFDQLMLDIVGILLVWPDQVHVSIRDATTSNVYGLRTRESEPSMDLRGEEKSSLLARTPRLLAQAMLYDGVDANSWVEVGARGLGITVRGCVCLVPTATRRLQFIAVGIEPMLDHHSANVLYEEVNRVFANSAFGIIEGDSDEDSSDAKEKVRALRIRDLKVRRGIDRWPIFSLQILFDNRPTTQTMELEDLLDDGSPDLAAIIDLLRAMSHQFLKRHHFRPKLLASAGLHQEGGKQKMRTPAGFVVGERQPAALPVQRQGSSRRSESSNSGRTTPSALGSGLHRRSESPFDAWSRVKIGRPLSVAKVGGQTPESRKAVRAPLVDGTGKLLRKPFGDCVPTRSKDQHRPDPEKPHSGLTQEDEGKTKIPRDTVVWVDPVTKVRSTIDSRTGFVVDSDSTTGRRMSLRTPFADAGKQLRPEPAPWIKEMLSDWQNPAFAPTEPPIPRIPDPVETVTQAASASTTCGHLRLGDASETSVMQFEGRVSRRALHNAKVIAQVDSKFILVSVTLEAAGSTSTAMSESAGSDPGELLVLIDQHAADERCGVEELQKDYFISGNAELGARTNRLETPIQVEVSREEGLLLARYKEHFEYWGVVYTVNITEAAREPGMQPKAKIQIQSLPPSILERCRLEPRLLIELVRKEAWKLRDEPGLVVSTRSRPPNTSEEENNSWVRRFHGCPQAILDLINSRSCRSAIMFNDDLSLEQCQKLVLRLADCVFPFQCAHGRPSMVPLVDLGVWSGFGSALEEERAGAYLTGKMGAQRARHS